MVARRSGLIVSLSSIGGRIYFYNVPYCVGKAGVDKLAETMAEDLREFEVAAVSLCPGMVMTERIRDMNTSTIEPCEEDALASPNVMALAIAELASNPMVFATLTRLPELTRRVIAWPIG